MHRYAQLQVHWTNDRKLSNLYDSSGIKLFYTPNLRKYDLATLITGQLHLELPPGKNEVLIKRPGGNLICLWYGVVPFFRVPFS